MAKITSFLRPTDSMQQPCRPAHAHCWTPRRSAKRTTRFFYALLTKKSGILKDAWPADHTTWAHSKANSGDPGSPLYHPRLFTRFATERAPRSDKGHAYLCHVRLAPALAHLLLASKHASPAARQQQSSASISDPSRIALYQGPCICSSGSVVPLLPLPSKCRVRVDPSLDRQLRGIRHFVFADGTRAKT